MAIEYVLDEFHKMLFSFDGELGIKRTEHYFNIHADATQELAELQADNARLRLVESAAKKLQSRLDEHFGGDPSNDWKEQAELRAALKGDVS